MESQTKGGGLRDRLSANDPRGQEVTVRALLNIVERNALKLTAGLPEMSRMKRQITIAMILIAATALPYRSYADGAGAHPWMWANDDRTYEFTAAGEVQSIKGASVSLTARHAGPKGYGGVVTEIDAHSARGRTVSLFANLSSKPGSDSVAIWLRADRIDGSHVFSTSARFPVQKGQSNVFRRVRIQVPDDAQKVVLGLVLLGAGAAQANDMRIEIGANTPQMHVRAHDLMRQVIALIQQHALHADRINWDQLQSQVDADLGPTDDAEKAYPLIEAVLKRLNDLHSSFLPPDLAWQMEAGAASYEIEAVKVLADGTGYVLLPGFNGSDADSVAYVSRIWSSLSRLAPKVCHGWVLDLRENGGGNFWPMLAAMAPFLGPGKVGAFRFKNGNEREWRPGQGVGHGGSAPIDLSRSSVAVLFGKRTSSSGEALATAFRGRSRTRSFGSPTGGQANANSSHTLLDGSRLNIASAVDIDRNGVEMKNSLQPDVAVSDGRRDDAEIGEAVRWLSAN